jgi:hypothetical protein
MTLREPLPSDDIRVLISELLVATADASDPLLDDSVSQILRLLRLKLNMDVVFVSEFVDGKRVFRFVDTRAGAAPIKVGDSNPLEESVCRRIVDGRLPGLIKDLAALPPEQRPPLPFRVGAHLSTPIVMRNGRTYGTLCCFSAAASAELRDEDLKNLQLCAELVAKKLERANTQVAGKAPENWQLEPMESTDQKEWVVPTRRGSER